MTIDCSSIAERVDGLRERLRTCAVPDNVQVSVARSGERTLQVGGRYVHSSYDPRREARKRVDGAGIEPGAPVIVLGLGLGYHVEELLRATSGTVLVVEADDAVAAAAMDVLEIDPAAADRCMFYVGRQPGEITGDAVFKGLVEEGATLFRFDPSIRLDPDYYARIEKGMHSARRDAPAQLRVFVVGPIYGGSVPVARYTVSALRRLGHHVEFMDCSEYNEPFESIKKKVKGTARVHQLESEFVSFLSDLAVVRASEFGAHLVFALAQAPLHEGAVRRLRSRGIVTAFWFIENYRHLDYWRQMAPEYDVFFTIQRDPFFRHLDSLGVKNYAYVPVGCDPQVHRPVELDDDERSVYGADVSFAGAAYHNRLVTFEALADKDFKLWGIGWGASPMLRPLVQKDGAPFTTDEMIKVFAGSKVSVNLHSSNQSDCTDPNPDFFNPRMFELASSGAFQLVDDRPGLDEMFEPGAEIVTFRDAADLRLKVEYYLDHDDERRAIARRARDRALRDHTYDRRLAEMIEFIIERAGDRLANRPREVFWTAGEAATVGQVDDGLKALLSKCPPETPFTLQGILEHVGSGEDGPQHLSDAEGLMLLLNEIVATAKIE